MPTTLDLEMSIGRFLENAKQSKGALVGIKDAYEDIGDASKKAIGGAASDQDKLDTAVGKTTKEYKQQEGIIEQLEGHLKRLETGQRKVTDVKTVKKYNTEIAKTRGALNSLKTAGVGSIGAVNTAATASQGIFNGLRATLVTTFAPLFAVTTAVAGLKAVIDEVSTFNQTAADLSAITGAQGEDLEFLKQSAVEVGVTTTASANDTLEAYKLIASAKPELLQNAEALAAITKEAVTLSEASGLDLPTSATALTDALNQFSAPAEEAGRFINVLAAASQQGAAEIPQVTDALLSFGVAAKSSNISVEESVGAIETLAEKGLKGAEAGTALRNVFSKLSATELLPADALKRLEGAGINIEALSDKSLSLEDRLKALAPIQSDANALTAVFGLENKNAAQIILENVDRYSELTEAITGTNTANEQAAVRTATISGEFTKLKNTISALIQGNGDGFGEFIALIIRFAREGIVFLGAAIDEVRPTLSSLGETFGELFDSISELLPAADEAGEGFDYFGTAVKVFTVPLKLAITLIDFLVKNVNKNVQAFNRLTSNSPKLKQLFDFIAVGYKGLVDVFINLPQYVEGGFNAIETFLVETQKGFSQFGSNIGNTIKEAFSFKKLITEGTGDLENALSNLLTNPFEGAAGRIQESFLKPFEEARASAIALSNVDVAVTPETSLEGAGDTPNDDPEKPKKFVDPEKAKKAAEKAAREALKLQKDIDKARIEALADGVEKELVIEQARFDDLISKLEQYGIETEGAVYQHELNKFNIKQKFAEDQANLDGLTGEERIQYLYDQTTAEIDAIESALAEASGGELIAEQQQQINLLRKQASDSYLEQLSDFQSKEKQEAQQHEINLLELKRDSFDTQKEFEEFKQQEILNIRLKYAEAQLKVIESVSGADSDAALSLRGTINKIKGEIASISETGGAAQEFNLFKLFGLDENDPQSQQVIAGIEAAAEATIGILNQVTEARVKAAEENLKITEQELDEIQKKIDAKQEQVDEEERLNNEGIANDLETQQDELALLRQQEAVKKQERDKALKEKQKAQKAQLIIDTVVQASSLITAAAQIFASVAAIPFVGPVLGAALVAGMIGSFVAAKAKAFQSVSKQKAEKGMYGRVKGKRHTDGGEKFGDHIEVEDGEDFGILSRAATKQFSGAFKAFVQAANTGNRKAMLDVSEKLGGRAPIDHDLVILNESKENEIKEQQIKITANTDNPALRENNALLKKIIEKDSKPKKTTEYKDGKKIIKVGNHTRVIRKSNG